jgi:hypothetical protein
MTAASAHIGVHPFVAHGSIIRFHKGTKSCMIAYVYPFWPAFLFKKEDNGEGVNGLGNLVPCLFLPEFMEKHGVTSLRGGQE